MSRDIRIFVGLGQFRNIYRLFEEENPGIGGTAFVSIRLALLMKETYPHRNVSLVTDSHELSKHGDPGGRVDVLDWNKWKATKSDCLVISNSQFRDEDVAVSACDAGRLIGWSHHPFDVNFRSSLLKKFDAIVSPGLFALDSNRALGIECVHIPHPTVRPRSGSDKLDKIDQPVNFVYMSSGLLIKGFWDIIQIWEVLSQKSPNSVLHMVGPIPYNLDGPHLRNIGFFFLDQVEAGRIVLHGNMTAGKYELFETMQIGLLNPRGLSESFQLTAFEFMAAGLPLVSSAKHGNFESMRFFPENVAHSNRSIANTAADLAADPSTMAELSRRARECAGEMHRLGPEIARRWLYLVDCDEDALSSPTLPPFWNIRGRRRRVVMATAGLVHYKLRLKRKWRHFDNR